MRAVDIQTKLYYSRDITNMVEVIVYRKLVAPIGIVTRFRHIIFSVVVFQES